MTDYFDKFKKRMSTEGSSYGEAFKNSTIHFINDVFEKNPSYKTVIVNGINVGVIEIKDRNDSKNKELLFKTGEDFDIGGVVEDEIGKWLIFDFIKDDVMPKAMIKKCNELLRWKFSGGTLNEQPVFIEPYHTFELSDIEKDFMDFDTVTGGLNIYVQLNSETLKIELSHRFVFGTKVYEVIGIDDVTFADNGIGLLKLKMTLTPIQKDNLVGKIGDNIENDSGGGSLW